MKKLQDLWNHCIEIWKTPVTQYTTKKNLQNDLKIVLFFALGMVIIEIIHPVESLENIIWGIGIVGFCIFMASLTIHILDWLVSRLTNQPLFQNFGHKFVAFYPVYSLIFLYLYILRTISFSLNLGLFYGEWSWVLYWRTLPFGFLIYLIPTIYEYKQTFYERSIQQFNTKNTYGKKRLDDPQTSLKDSLIYLPTEAGSIELSAQDITHITVKEHYLHVNYLTQGVLKEIIIRKTLKTIQEELPYPLFQQIHRSHLVNIEHISQIKKEKRLYFSFVYQDQFKLPIGRSYLSQTLLSVQTLL
jgi:hypothetical protein